MVPAAGIPPFAIGVKRRQNIVDAFSTANRFPGRRYRHEFE
jgi:hypothetical protein